MTNTNDFKQISAEGEFSLWVDSPIYKSYVISCGGYVTYTSNIKDPAIQMNKYIS